MAFEEKFLGQLAPTSVSPETLFTATKKTIIKTIIVCNIGTANKFNRFSIYYSPSGAFYNTGTALYFNTSIPAPIGNEINNVKQINTFIVLNPGGSIGVQCFLGAGSITFSMFGAEID